MAFGMLVDAYIESGSDATVLNLAQGAYTSKKIGTFSAWRIAEYIRIVLRFFVTVLSKRFDVVYLQGSQSVVGFLRDALVIHAAKLLKCRVVCHIHGGNYDNFVRRSPRRMQKFIEATLDRVDKIVLLSERLKPMMAFDEALKDRLCVVENSVPFRLDAGHGPRKRRGGAVRVLYMSNLVESKGYLTVMRAADFLVNSLGRRDVCFEFCGEFLRNRADDTELLTTDGARQAFEQYVRERGLGSHVKYGGVVSGDVKTEVLTNSDIFVLPTNYNNEGQPISILEAMAYGMPVISTEYRAIPDMVIDGETGYFVPFDDEKALADSIVKMVDSVEIYEAMSERAFELVKSKFSIEEHQRKLRAVIEA